MPLPISEGMPDALGAGVLLVEDDHNLRRAFRRCLALVGFEVWEAGDGAAALDLVRAVNVSLVVSDIQMPVMDGLELLQVLSRQWSWLPVLLMSGSDEPSRAGVMARGAVDLLQKPFSMVTLQQAALRAIGKPATATTAPSLVLAAGVGASRT